MKPARLLTTENNLLVYGAQSWSLNFVEVQEIRRQTFYLYLYIVAFVLSSADHGLIMARSGTCVVPSGYMAGKLSSCLQHPVHQLSCMDSLQGELKTEGVGLLKKTF